MRIRRKDFAVWHRWFAWHPISKGCIWVWWEFVQRRYVYIGMGEYEKEYRIEQWPK